MLKSLALLSFGVDLETTGSSSIVSVRKVALRIIGLFSETVVSEKQNGEIETGHAFRDFGSHKPFLIADPSATIRRKETQTWPEP